MIFKLLLSSLSHLDEWNKISFFKGEYGWYYYSEKCASFNTKFKKLLVREQWLFDKNNNQVTPSEISISELAENYIIDDNNIEVFEKALGFQNDKIKQVELEFGGKFIPTEEFDQYEQWKAEKKANVQNEGEEDEIWKPEFLPEEVEISASEDVMEMLESKDLSYQTSNSGSITNYDENSKTIPYNNYGWSKLGAECAVRLLPNHVIVRTRFFDEEKIIFKTSATDIYTSSIPVIDLVKSLHKLIDSDFIGTINIGLDRMSDFDRKIQYKPSITKTTRAVVEKEAGISLPGDTSMDCSLWGKIFKTF